MCNKKYSVSQAWKRIGKSSLSVVLGMVLLSAVWFSGEAKAVTLPVANRVGSIVALTGSPRVEYGLMGSGLVNNINPSLMQLGSGTIKKGSDTYTQTETVSWFDRIGESIGGLFVGLLMFFGAFVLLYWNEGKIDISRVAQTAMSIAATESNPAAEGLLVSVTDTVKSEELLGDKLFLKPGKYLAISREVDMFAWDEEKETTSEKNIGGSETRTTTYKYSQKWVNRPEKTSDFNQPEGHENPQKEIEDVRDRVGEAKIGIYSLDVANIELPREKELPLKSENINLTPEVTQVGNYLFKGNGTMENPEVGDLRIQYKTLPAEIKGTVFGKLESGNKITSYTYKSKKQGTSVELYEVFSGTRDEAIAKWKEENTQLTWILRVVGLGLMWFGLMLFAEPISVVLDVLPILGTISRGVVAGLSLGISLLLSSITIIVSMLWHKARRWGEIA